MSFDPTKYLARGFAGACLYPECDHLGRERAPDPDNHIDRLIENGHAIRVSSINGIPGIRLTESGIAYLANKAKEQS
jgi:hypothetical protein